MFLLLVFGLFLVAVCLVLVLFLFVFGLFWLSVCCSWCVVVAVVVSV